MINFHDVNIAILSSSFGVFSMADHDLATTYPLLIQGGGHKISSVLLTGKLYLPDID